MTFYQQILTAVVQGVTTGIIGGIFIGIGQIISKIWVEPYLLQVKKRHDKVILHIKKRSRSLSIINMEDAKYGKNVRKRKRSKGTTVVKARG